MRTSCIHPQDDLTTVPRPHSFIQRAYTPSGTAITTFTTASGGYRTPSFRHPPCSMNDGYTYVRPQSRQPQGNINGLRRIIYVPNTRPRRVGYGHLTTNTSFLRFHNSSLTPSVAIYTTLLRHTSDHLPLLYYTYDDLFVSFFLSHHLREP